MKHTSVSILAAAFLLAGIQSSSASALATPSHRSAFLLPQAAIYGSSGDEIASTDLVGCSEDDFSVDKAKKKKKKKKGRAS
jgi:hypothetical protein